jgi:hypothetical protein
MQTIAVKLRDDLVAQLAREAESRGGTKSLLIRESLERALRQRRLTGIVSCYDLASDLAGSIKRLPKDLAENPKYMDGFAG